MIPATAALLAFAGSALAAGELPYLYQRTGFGSAGLLAVEAENAAGTRDAALFGQHGVEQGLRLRYGVGDRVTAELWSGVLFADGGERRTGGAFELFFGVLSAPLELTLGAGLAHDFRDDDVIRLRATASRPAGAWELSLNNLTEIPLGSERDKVDLILGSSVMRTLGGGARAGLELVGQDLEGFWDPHEAEGGARLAAGPTIWARLSERVEIKGNCAAVIQATRNAYLREGVLVDPPGDGVLARLALRVEL